MDQDTPRQSIAERAAAFKSDAPSPHALISFRQQAELIEVAYSLKEKAATQFMVRELQEAASALPLYWLFRGGEVRRIDDTRVPMEPDAMPAGWTATHYPSDRDQVLGDLAMALVFGHVIGDQTHEATRKAVALHMLKADGDAYFIEPSPVMVAVRKRERAEEEARQRAAAAAAAAPESSDGHAGPDRPITAPEDPTAGKARRMAIAGGFRRTKFPGERWVASDRAELLRQYLVLRGIGEEWAKAELAHAELASRWGITTSSVRVYLTKARTEAQAAGKPAGRG
jgi:hypothetical protein